MGNFDSGDNFYDVFCSLLILNVGLVEYVAIVGRHVLPMIEGIAVGIDGNRGLVLVHQELHENIV